MRCGICLKGGQWLGSCIWTKKNAPCSPARTEELLKINTTLLRKPEPNLEKLGRRIGRHQGKNPTAAKHIHGEVQRDAKRGATTVLKITTPLSKGQSNDQHHGA